MLVKGFTKTELLIVAVLVFIVLIIDVFVIIHLNNKIHDIRVLSDISRIRSGLEVYLYNYNYYPSVDSVVDLNSPYVETQKLCLSGFESFDTKCEKNILNPLPNFYEDEDEIFRYLSAEDNQNYQLEFILKTNFRQQGLVKGVVCADNYNMSNSPCF